MGFEDQLRKKKERADRADAERRTHFHSLGISKLSQVLREGKVDTGLRSDGGRDKVVFIDPDDPDKVYKMYREQSTARDANQFRGNERRTIENQSKVNFWLQRTLHGLFPKNIPYRDLAGTQPKFTRDQRLRYHPYEHYYVTATDRSQVPLEVLDLINTLEDLGINVDAASKNFGKDEEGNVVYTDDLYMEDGAIEKLEAWITSIDEKPRHEVAKMLSRLKYWVQK
jgi:hypothetical protein